MGRRVTIGRAPVDAYTFDETVDAIVAHAAARRPPAYVVTPNAQHVVLLRDDARLRAAYDGAWLSVPDGVPLLWAARLLGSPLPGRVNGTDLFEAVCGRAAGDRLTVFLLGGRPGAADRAAAVLRERYPGLDVRTCCPPYGFERNERGRACVVEAVRAEAPHILFVGLGAPKQEYWMREHHAELGVPVSVGVGGSFELVSGMVRRAPPWMRSAGLEWLFRLLVEPRRLWRRYVVTNSLFIGVVLAQYVGERAALAGRR